MSEWLQPADCSLHWDLNCGGKILLSKPGDSWSWVDMLAEIWLAPHALLMAIYNYMWCKATVPDKNTALTHHRVTRGVSASLLYKAPLYTFSKTCIAGATGTLVLLWHLIVIVMHTLYTYNHICFWCYIIYWLTPFSSSVTYFTVLYSNANQSYAHKGVCLYCSCVWHTTHTTVWLWLQRIPPQSSPPSQSEGSPPSLTHQGSFLSVLCRLAMCYTYLFHFIMLDL